MKIAPYLIASIMALTTAWATPGTFSYSGYVDFFYAAHSGATGVISKPYSFLYNYPDNNQLALNHALVEFKYTSDTWYSALGLQSGRYTEENYAAEPLSIRPIYSAFLGYKLTSEWAIEGGIFGSHIGFESAISKDCCTLTRSLIAESSPFFESGLKAIYTPHSTLTITTLLLNGWQNIQDTNSSKAVGLQVQYQLSPQVLLNSSTFIGNEKPDSVAGETRYFHDLFAVITVNDNLAIIPVLDLGFQGSSSWQVAEVLAQYKLNPKWRMGGRIGYLSDPNEVVTSGKLSLVEVAANIDHDLIGSTCLWRNEVKVLSGTGIDKTDISVTTSLSIAFSGKEDTN